MIRSVLYLLKKREKEIWLRTTSRFTDYTDVMGAEPRKLAQKIAEEPGIGCH